MDTLAVIQSGGKQYVVKENDVIDVEIVKNLKKDDKFSLIYLGIYWSLVLGIGYYYLHLLQRI